MRKFKYRAETYLRYVGHLRDQALYNFKEAEHQVQQIKNAILDIEDAMKKAFQRNSEIGDGNTTIHFVNDNNTFIQFLKRRNAEFKEELVEAESVYKEKYEKLIELQTKLKSLEKHKEKKQDEYDKELKKYEQKKLDEMNSARYGGKGAGSGS